MKNSKITFAIIVAAVLALCILVMFLPQNTTPGQSDIITESTTEPTATLDGPTESTGENSSVMPTATLEDPPTYELAENVRMTKVDKDPNEIVHAFEPISEDDPEYLPTGSDSYETMEGKVFRNDKTISIDIFDEFLGETYTFTFGYITGECNRFLYLNPVCEQAGKNNQFGFHFNTMRSGGGSIFTLPIEYDTEEAAKKADRSALNFTLERTLDQRTISDYMDPTHPGTVWFTQTPLQGDLWIDVMVYQMGGDFIATLRLTIAKDADGTYSIVNLENKNLLQLYDREDALFSKEELGYIYSLADTVVNDPDTIEIVNNSLQSNTPIERYLMEYRNDDTSLYFPYFVPAGDGYCAKSTDYLYNPTIAVTVRHCFSSATCITMYFHVIKPPTATEHGVYEYIGRDFLMYTSKESLEGQGHPPF